MIGRRLSAHFCAWCGAQLDAATHTADPKKAIRPKRGDCAICIECGEWSKYERRGGRGALFLRKPTDDEMLEIGLNDDCRRARQAWVAVIQPKLKERAGGSS